MKTHPFDKAIKLAAQDDGTWLGRTSAAYGNMVGPFGGITAAQALNAVLCHPDLLGEPVSLTVNFAAALSDGEFSVQARAARTNRSTQHWIIEMLQAGQTVLTATAVTALRRETWSVDEESMPACPLPDDVPLQKGVAPIEFVKRYELRPIVGGMPEVWDASGHSSLSQLWVRDQPPRALDFASLCAIADIFFPRVFIRRSTHVPVGTVSMTVYFHAGAEQLAKTGDGYLLGQARAQAFRNGFFDQTSQLWSHNGDLLVTTHQVVYYKE
ncbi:MAG: thioesterase family protein [Burkholderiales bacterium]|nr:thioesterase family protein [Burkholderiales bacterium]